MKLSSFCRQIIVFVVLVLVSSTGRSTPNDEAVFEQLVKSIFIQTLQEIVPLGVTEISGKDLLALGNQSLQIQVIALPDIDYRNKTLPGTSRHSGYWVLGSDSKLVVLSVDHLKQLKDGLLGNEARGLILHEFFGPLGIEDGNFSKSAMLGALLIHKTRIAGRKSNKKVVQHIQVAGGGTSGVGGGGDVRAYNYMLMIFSELFFQLEAQEITEQEYENAVNVLDKIKIDFSSTLRQGDFKFDKQSLSLLIPADAANQRNIDLNWDSVVNLIKENLIKPEATQ